MEAHAIERSRSENTINYSMYVLRAVPCAMHHSYNIQADDARENNTGYSQNSSAFLLFFLKQIVSDADFDFARFQFLFPIAQRQQHDTVGCQEKHSGKQNFCPFINRFAILFIPYNMMDDKGFHGRPK